MVCPLPQQIVRSLRKRLTTRYRNKHCTVRVIGEYFEDNLNFLALIETFAYSRCGVPGYEVIYFLNLGLKKICDVNSEIMISSKGVIFKNINHCRAIIMREL